MMKRIISILFVLLCALFLESNSIASQKEENTIPPLTALATRAAIPLVFNRNTNGDIILNQENLSAMPEDCIRYFNSKEVLEKISPLSLQLTIHPFIKKKTYTIQKTELNDTDTDLQEIIRKINESPKNHIVQYLDLSCSIDDDIKHIMKDQQGKIEDFTIYTYSYPITNIQGKNTLLKNLRKLKVQNVPSKVLSITDFPYLNEVFMDFDMDSVRLGFDIKFMNCPMLKKITITSTAFLSSINLSDNPNCLKLVEPLLSLLNDHCTIILFNNNSWKVKDLKKSLPQPSQWTSWFNSNNNETVEKILTRVVNPTIDKQTVDSKTSNTPLTKNLKKNNVPSISFWAKLFTLINFTQTNPASSWTPTFITTWTSWLWNWKWFN